MDEKPEAASSEVAPDEQADASPASDSGGSPPVEPSAAEPDDPDELLASIRRLRRLDREKSRIPAGTSRFDALVRAVDEAARELFRRAAGAADGSRGSGADDSSADRTETRGNAKGGSGRRVSDAPGEGSDGPGT